MTDEQWKAIEDHDRSYDGRIFCGLKTTKVVCRPSCTARSCSRDNVEIFSSMEEAKARGYRPCLKCRPDVADWEGAKKELANAAVRLIEQHYTEKFSLDAIASSLYVDGSYLARVFKANTGHSLLSYHNYVRCRNAERLLIKPELSVSYIGETVGYSSTAHFTRVFKRMTSLTPSEYRKEAFAKAMSDNRSFVRMCAECQEAGCKGRSAACQLTAAVREA